MSATCKSSADAVDQAVEEEKQEEKDDCDEEVHYDESDRLLENTASAPSIKISKKLSPDTYFKISVHPRTAPVKPRSAPVEPVAAPPSEAAQFALRYS